MISLSFPLLTSETPDPVTERERITGIIDRLMARFNLDEYRRLLVDEPIEQSLNVVNDENFRCPTERWVNISFRNNLEKYETRIKEIEEGVRDRLDLETLGPDEGLVVISFYAHGYAQNVEINRLGAIGGGISFGPVNNNEYFRVLKVKLGADRPVERIEASDGEDPIVSPVQATVLHALRRALAILETSLGDEHPNTRHVRENLDLLLAELSNPTG